MIIKKNDIDNLAETVLFANTPFYLYKKLSENDSVRNLSQKYSTEKLLSVLERLIEEEKNEITNLAEIYSIFIALLNKPISEIPGGREFFNSISVRWSSHLAEIHQSKQIGETFSSLDNNFRIDSRIDYSNSNNSDYRETKIAPKVDLF